MLFIVTLIFSMYGLVNSAEDPYGCYSFEGKGFTDEICIYRSGVYKQHYYNQSSELIEYNNSKYRIFSYQDDGKSFTAFTLNNYLFNKENGRFFIPKEIDVVPKDEFLYGTYIKISINSVSREYFKR